MTHDVQLEFRNSIRELHRFGLEKLEKSGSYLTSVMVAANGAGLYFVAANLTEERKFSNFDFTTEFALFGFGACAAILGASISVVIGYFVVTKASEIANEMATKSYRDGLREELDAKNVPAPKDWDAMDEQSEAKTNEYLTFMSQLRNAVTVPIGLFILSFVCLAIGIAYPAMAGLFRPMP